MVIFNHQPEHSDPRNYPDNYGPNQDCAIQALWLGADRERDPHWTKCGNSHWQKWSPNNNDCIKKKQRSQKFDETHWPLGCCKMANFLGEPNFLGGSMVPLSDYPVLGDPLPKCVPRSSTRRTGVSRWRNFPPRCFTTYLGGVFQWLQLRGFLNCASQESIAKTWNTGFHNPSQVFSIAICAHVFSIAKRFSQKNTHCCWEWRPNFAMHRWTYLRVGGGQQQTALILVVSYRLRIGAFFH